MRAREKHGLGGAALALVTGWLIACGAPGATGGETAASPQAATAATAPPASGGTGECSFPNLPEATAATLAGSRVAFSLLATGVQVYRCDVAATGASWTLVGPDATLADASGVAAGKHYAAPGPTWEAADGSKVMGAKLASVPVDANAIPWLVLEAKSHEGAGRMAKVDYVERTQTSGGVPPATGCDEAHRGQTARVDYKATYSFCEPK